MTTEYPRVAPSPEKLAQVMALVKSLKERLVEHAKLEEEAKSIKQSIEELAKLKIPELMLEMGLRELPLPGGDKLVVEDKISAKIPEARFDEAIAWLDKKGEGGMVKRVVSVAFNRDQEEAAKVLVANLREKFAGVKVDAWIEPPTLKAFATRQVQAGVEDFPKELFGVYRFDQASVKEPRKPKSKGDKDSVFDE